MIFAAGRGERMRPLSDTCPKPLLKVGGKALIVWQIERLAQAGFHSIIINHAWLGEQIEAELGDGARWGVTLIYSAENPVLETAGGIAHALPWLEAAGRPRIFAAVSGDVYCEFDYARLHAHAARMALADNPLLHLVMVPNPDFRPDGDFALGSDGLLSLDGIPRYTFGNIGLYDTRMFHDLPRGTKCALTPYYRQAILARRASAELFEGRWENIGTPEQLYKLDEALRGAS
jgi:MurNAc alpha-1-phosphate uridylyltransferase